MRWDASANRQTLGQADRWKLNYVRVRGKNYGISLTKVLRERNTDRQTRGGIGRDKAFSSDIGQ